MKWLDSLLAWALALFGIACLLSAHFPRLALVRGPWSGSAAVAIVTMGLMNAVRAQRRNDRYLRWMTVLATAFTTALICMVLYRFEGNVLHQPAALGVAVVALFELCFGVAR